MKFTRIRLVGATNVDLRFLSATPTTPFILKAADGLGPPEIDVHISNTLYQGGVYQGRRPQGREVVMRVGLNPDYAVGQTAADLRTTLYGLLTPRLVDLITLQLVDDNDGNKIRAQATGYIKRIEINPFSKDPEVQITMACMSPYLEYPVNISADKLTLNKAAPVIEYTGTADTGFYLWIKFTAQTTNFTLTSDRGEKVTVNRTFLADDGLTIDTRDGLRNILLFEPTNPGVAKNMVKNLSTDSKWPRLHTGTNSFTTSSQNFTYENAFMHKPAFWGV